MAKRLGNWVFVLVLAFLLIGAGPVSGTRPVRAQGVTPEIGVVQAVALDAAGNGWAYAGPKPQTVYTSYLLRIENGGWRVGVDSEANRAVLPLGTHIVQMALTDRGDAGWAIGSYAVQRGETDERAPLLMRLQGGTWRVARTGFTPVTQILSVSITPDESDGWMTVRDADPERFRLLRLRNGSWDFVAQAVPANTILEQVALSPDGRSGLGIGIRLAVGDGPDIPVVFRLNGGRWELAQGDLAGTGAQASAVAADNAGNGWAIANSNGRGDHILVRLSRNAAPRAVALNVPRPAGMPNAELVLSGVAVDGNGRGWAAGSFFLGEDDSNPPETISRYQTVLIRLEGERATPVAPATTGYTTEANVHPWAVGVNRNGAHTWVGGASGVGIGRLQELREPWTHTRPAAAAPLSGAGRCFAEVPHCIRGAFATYWQSKGGLDLFGYPITPEVKETIGGREYTVQYTQRSRFEYHPENRAPNDVLLGLLGNALVEGRENEEPFKPKSPGIVPSPEWFPQTMHNVRPPFLAYWQNNGGLPVYGLPRSEAFEERNAADGKQYLVQYFERNRLEYHLENREPKFQMLLGLLGTEQFRKTYGFMP